MGIQVEYNPDLALRNRSEYVDGKRGIYECIPERLEAGLGCNFDKRGQRLYWLLGELPLHETDGKGNLSRPLASIVIKEATHYMKGDEIWTKGYFEVVEVFDSTNCRVEFEAWNRNKS